MDVLASLRFAQVFLQLREHSLQGEIEKEDEFQTEKQLSSIAHGFEVYQGTHTSAVAVRFQNYVLPFFSKNLCFGNNCK